jgi:sporulation protein YlmC with PRC-barrel domain
MLHKVKALLGYHIRATDGEIGHVDDVLIDDTGSDVRYLVVDTSNWIGGKSVLISSAQIEKIDSPHSEIRVNLTREAIKAGPSVSAADIDPSETLPAVWIM